jgi:hypothetical protein
MLQISIGNRGLDIVFISELLPKQGQCQDSGAFNDPEAAPASCGVSLLIFS